MKIKNLPTFWKHNKKASMTGDVMAEWQMQFGRKMIRKKSVEFKTIYENLLIESDDIEVFVEEVNLSSPENDIITVEEHPKKISSFKEALAEVRCLIKFSKEDYTTYEHKVFRMLLCKI